MSFYKINRRLHLYLGLALAPWMLMYAVSGIFLNHRPFFDARWRSFFPRYEKQAEQPYTKTFALGTKPQIIAEQILADLELKGTYNVNENKRKKRIVIHRASPLRPKRITYTSADKKLLIEREIRPIPLALKRIHFRLGYQHKYWLSDAWAVVVDLVIFAMFFWVISGLWIWWKMKKTRRFGLVCTTAGIISFIFFILVI